MPAPEVSQVSQSQPEFPIWALPPRVLLFVVEAADALVIDPAVLAGPCLAALAGCVGNRRRIVVNPGTWTEPACLWVALVLRSGGKKTPALSLVLGYLHEREAAEIEEEKARKAEYEEAMQEWKATPGGDRGEPPPKPEPAQRLLVSDVTTEALLALHAQAPLGLLLHRDELAGWLKSFNVYKGAGKGGDAQCFLEMHQGRPALIDRKGGSALSVPRACVSICGGIQPELLTATLAGEHLVDGLASRILFVVPPEKVKTWSDRSISNEARQGWQGLLDELLALCPDEDGHPVDLPMTAKAKELWVGYYNDHAQREIEAEGPLRSALSKLEAATARLALLVQLARDPRSSVVDAEAMAAGIEISGWFEDQARRVYFGAEEHERQRELQELCEWIAARGGSVTKRDLARYGPYKFRTRAGEVLRDLVSAERARCKKGRGRQADQFELCDRGTPIVIL